MSKPKKNTPDLFATLPGTPGGDIAALAGMKGAAQTGAMMISAAYPEFAADAVRAKTFAENTKASVRDANLNVWRDTPEGTYHEAVKAELMLTAAKQRSEQDATTLAKMKTLENAINAQMIRVADTSRGVAILRDAGFHVVLEQIGHSASWICYFRNEKGAGEQSNQRVYVEGLMQLANLKKHGVTDKTTAREVLDKLSGKAGKGNKQKGKQASDEVSTLVNSKTGDVLAALDNRLAALCDKEGFVDGTSKATRANAKLVFARLNASLTDAEKRDAIADFTKLAAIEKGRKNKRPSKRNPVKEIAKQIDAA